jgi:hypothetical protein
MEFNINITHFNGQELTKDEKDEVMSDIACMLEMKKYILAGGIRPIKNANLN